MTQSINIGRGQGLTQALKSYVEQLKKDGKIEGDVNISKAQWNATINDLQNINDTRTKDTNSSSIFSGGKGTNWSTDMIVKQGKVDFTTTELNSLLADMGVKLKDKTAEPAKTDAAAVKKDGTSFIEWNDKCADSIVNVDAANKPVYGKDVEAYAIDGDKIKNIANYEVGAADTDKNGGIDYKEQADYEIAAAEKKYGKMDAEMKKHAMQTSDRASLFMDLNGDKKVDAKEYEAFLKAMDLNKDNKISREENDKVTNYFEKTLDHEAGLFRQTVKENYKSLFGTDSTAK